MYVVPCSTDSCSYTLSGVVQTALKRARTHHELGGCLQKVKKNVIKTLGPRVGKFWCLDRWSLMGGGTLLKSGGRTSLEVQL